MNKQNYNGVYDEYQKGLQFNNQQSLNDIVRNNENFFIGKQWEGIEANGLPTPVFNFLKRVVLFTVASIASDNIKMQASAMGCMQSEYEQAVNVVNNELTRLMETNDVVSLVREYMRNAAVDGDGCLYAYWDPDVETEYPVKGAVVTEVIENTRVFFGNRNDHRTQKQPYIIISSREMIDDVKDKVKENGGNPDDVKTDTDDRNISSAHQTDDKVTVLLKMWKNKETGTIWAYECAQNMEIKKEWDTGLTLYPVTWLNWDYVQDNYHGMAMITGLIPNQIFINKSYAMSFISLMTSAYPKIIYDKTRIKKWTNQVGAAIGVNGGDVNTVAKNINPASMDPQVIQFINSAEEDTLSNLGATSVALGNTTPYNTSAIIALQKAASTPHEITKQNLYQSLKDLGKIYIDLMANHYGERVTEIKLPENTNDAAAFAQVDRNQSVTFDFSSLKNIWFSVKLDVGAASYWSEQASLQTLDNLFINKAIDVSDYIARIPNGYLPMQKELEEKYAGRSAGGAAQNQQIAGNTQEQIPTTAGNSNFQRQIVNNSGITG